MRRNSMKSILSKIGMIFTLLFTAQTTYSTLSLTDIQWKSSSVLPFFYNNKGEKYAILSREAAGRARGTYDDFGGKAETYDLHPLESAAREFWEEAILKDTINLTLEQTKEYLDIDNTENTESIIVYLTDSSSNVTYITDFTNYYKDFFNNFYRVRKKQTRWKFKEKNKIAIVKWNDLACAVKSNVNKDTPVMVTATIINTRFSRRHKQDITLRDFFVIKTQPFFLNEDYQQGTNKTDDEANIKIKIYDQQTIMHNKQQDITPDNEITENSL